ncbi:klarsicht protein [Aethina tumida]|uniref:klarsicht protein n=1 Tax=Aethina tumida TaxID=116153 RepID=UPI002147AEE9|nr:klarsicht protein [Aethina tumida]XP_049817340.1 klarsicht protein [Aethina tumida]XP_049817341.1 klarsicht protein [Aethina tumida]
MSTKNPINQCGLFHASEQSPNSATYYFTHDDTETETKNNQEEFECQDEQDETIQDVQLDEETCRYDPINTPPRKTVSEDTIRELVNGVEELVTTEMYRKRKSKLRLRNDDSCDASGEDDERDSQYSDYDVSTSTLKGLNNNSMSEGVLFPEYKANDRNRKLYGSCTPLNQTCSTPRISSNTLSMSESALYDENYPPKFGSLFANGSNSTSSTMEEASNSYLEQPSPIRRKKRRSRTFGKSDSHLMNSFIKPKSMLLKSCSFAGFSNHQSPNEPVPEQLSLVSSNCETSTTSGGETDEEHVRRYSRYNKDKYNLNLAEEQLSSLSDTWDNYQENYLSEPYSESKDSDAARRLLEFGEDYRKFLDSQSDWSTMSSEVSPVMKRKQWSSKPLNGNLNIIKSTSEKLENCRDTLYNYNFDLDYNTNVIDELLSECCNEIHAINRIVRDMTVSMDEEILSDILKQWEDLRNSALKMKEYANLQKQITDMKTSINSLDVSKSSYYSFSPIEEVKNDIEDCKNRLSFIDQYYEKLTALNAVVHRFSLENKDMDVYNSKLKCNVQELYELLDNSKTLTKDQLEQKQGLLPQLETLETRLEQLQKDLCDDGRSIARLDNLLNEGIFNDQTAAGVRDIAKLLSESTYHNGHHLSDFLTEGSFSDSGISDEGSEHEIGERQARLAAIRRLYRQYEAKFPLDITTKQKIFDKFNKVEEDLKTAQLRCRTLVARTSACSASTLSSQQKDAIKSFMTKDKGGDDDPGDNRSSVWYQNRSVKASIVFQVIILTFVCLSYWLNPQCCDNMNNYKWSLSPKLHFEGRPPI